MAAGANPGGKIMKKLVLLVLGAVAASALAQTPIPVANYNFSILPPGGLPNYGAAGGFYSVDQIPDWTETPGTSGQFQPTQGGGSFLLDPPTTTTWAFSNAGEGVATIYQTVVPAVQAGETYTLTVDIGYNGGNGAGFDGSADLLINGVAYNATGTAPAPGFYSVYTATYLGTVADQGDPITIQLNSTGAQGDFTDVTLTAPEGGASWLYLLVAGAASFGVMLFASRNKLASRAQA
jgi:hypothetical protein